ncbi:MAG: hypothetical protein IJP62_00605 [Treponema sp.]|nr:hypothetical protein [Treponema sp.]
MKKILKSLFLTLLCLILVGGAVFYLGWVQFKVKTDECGVLVSKTSGVYPQVIEKGVFCWRWEPLLPTNAKLMTFQLKPHVYSKSVRGSLPSAEVYAAQLKGAPEFAYKFDFDISLKVGKKALLEKAADSEITSSDELDSHLNRTADRLAELIAEYFILASAEDPTKIATARSKEQILSGIGSAADLGDVEVVSIFVKNAQIPDATLYNRAKQTYMTFQDYVDEALTKSAQHQADTILSDNRAVSRLTQIGETLKKYPELTDILKNGDSVEFINSLNSTVGGTSGTDAVFSAPRNQNTEAEKNAPQNASADGE